MARSYPIPPDTSEKEKAIGGILTFAQFGWLVGGFVIALLVFLLIKLLTNSTTISVICASPFVLLGTPFAFYTKYEMSYFQYLIKNKKFKKKTKKLINKKIL